MKLNLGCPKYCEEYGCVDLFPNDPRVIKAEAIAYLSHHENVYDEVKAFNLIEHLPNVGIFFEVTRRALKHNGILKVRTDNAEWFPFYIPLINMLSWGAHSSDKYYPKIMNGTKHYCVFTTLHLRHYAELYRFQVVKLSRVTFGARLLATLRKP